MALLDDIRQVLNEAVTTDGTAIPANVMATSEPVIVAGDPTATVDSTAPEAAQVQEGEVVVNPDYPEKDDAQDQTVTEQVKALCSQKIDAAVFGKLLEGEFTQEFKDSVVAIVESTVNARVKEAAGMVFEALEKNFERKVAINEAKLAEKEVKLNEALVKYADTIAEEWLQENQIAIESALRVELNESFMGGLKKLFEDHYIDVPADKVDVIDALNKKIGKLTEQMNGEIAKNVSLREEIQKGKKKAMIDETMKGMTVIGAEKVRALAESTDFVSEEDFSKKLKVLKENFEKAPSAPTVAKKVDSTTDGGKPLAESTNDPMDFYVRHAVRSHKEA